MQSELSGAARVAERAARAAGAIIQARAPSVVRHKGTVDLVTEVDLAAEEAIRTILEADTPGTPILAEESGGARDASTRWIVDPLDGTTNFVHGFPSYGVSIALQLDGALSVGCVYDAVRGQAYVAAAGQGATCEGQPIHVSTTEHLDDALLLTGFAYDRRQRADFYVRFVKAFLECSQGIRRAGSAAIDLCHIAAGRADGYWEFGLSPWDVAAGALLVQEAGGVVTDVALTPLGVDRPRILASNGRVHIAMAQVIHPLLSST